MKKVNIEKKLEKAFQNLVKTIQDEGKKTDFQILRRAFEFAKLAHAGEKRLSGHLMIWHPLETALILARWKMDIATVTAGLLHDTIEHGAATRKDILDNFGQEILNLVDGVTKVSKIKLVGSSEEYFVENLRKMFLAIAEDLRIVFLRLAERIDNLKSLEYLPQKRRINYAKDSLEIYAPLAERLGMWEVSSQINDLAFKYIYPKEYEKVLTDSKQYFKDAERTMLMVKKEILKYLRENEVEGEIVFRKKGLYSLWRKLEREEINWDFEKIHDIFALRVLVNEVPDCYLVLGIIHKLYKPITNLKVSDFIAVPKPNGYQSIHTKVYNSENKIVEVQVRTYKMHEMAEYGAAAHWQMNSLKLKGKISSKDIDQGKWVSPEIKLTWVKELAKWQKEIKNSKEFLQAVKFDALSKRIFVFSPKGDAFDLPEKSTSIDFAYAVHSGLGGYIKGAKVDGKIVGLDCQLQNGQVIEILKTKEERKPSSDWLKFVVTTLARREIKKKLHLTKIDKK